MNYTYFPLSPRVAAQLLLRALGGPGSGNFNHVGQGNGLVGGSGPAGGEAEAAATEMQLGFESTQGIAAVQRIFDAQDYHTVNGDDDDDEFEGSWDDLDSDTQKEIENKFRDDMFENSIDVDDSYIIDEKRKELQTDEKVLEETASQTIVALNREFNDEDSVLPLADELGEGGFNLRKRIDPDSIVYDEDDPNSLMVDELRFKSGEFLSIADQQTVTDVWREQYEKRVDSHVDKFRESDDYYDQRNELESEAVNDAWSNLSGSDKVGLASTFDIDISSSRPSDGQAPAHWMSADDSVGTPKDYARTRATALGLVEARFEEIQKERGINPTDGSAPALLWSDWKSSSTSVGGQLLQIAAADELHGVHRLGDVAGAEAYRRARSYDGYANVKAYVRAQWEVSQFVLNKEGKQSLPLYRGIMLDATKLDGEPKTFRGELGFGAGNSEVRQKTVAESLKHIWAAPSGGNTVQLHTLPLKRNGAASTTMDRKVANDWNGIGDDMPPNPTRVVLRFQVPRTAVLSLPVFGQNIHKEKEVVIAGTRGKWKWDAWLRTAPQISSTIPVKGRD